MHDALALALGHMLSAEVLIAMAMGIPVGLVFGVLPGLGGITVLAILIPFAYGMSPIAGVAFLLSAHAITYTGGSVTAILLGIPGTAPNAATVTDGLAMAKQGRAGEAVGAALASSALGGVLGGLLLLAMLPFLKPVVQLFGSPETFFLAIIGILFIGAIGEGRPSRGLIAGALGIFLACIGEHEISGTPRFWLGSDYLYDGLYLVPISLGLFGIPEIMTMMATGRGIADVNTRFTFADVWRGIAATGQHWWLVTKSSVIGVVVGIIPGVGGETCPFVAYAAAKQSSKEPERFGKGAIEGVIAPEASNNAKEGGALVPTLAFGIPGSAGMAILLGGFLVLGLLPGPDFLQKHMDISYAMAFIVAIANLVGAAIMIGTAKWTAQITRIPGRILGTPLLVLIVLGAYTTTNSAFDIVTTIVFGFIGFFMQKHGFSRAALLLGFVLGAQTETYLHISLSAYGTWFFYRPVSLILLALIVATLAWAFLRRIRRKDALHAA